MRGVVLVSVLFFLVAAPAAQGDRPAPGAPGAIHTWAPADKQGFGTAHHSLATPTSRCAGRR